MHSVEYGQRDPSTGIFLYTIFPYLHTSSMPTIVYMNLMYPLHISITYSMSCLSETCYFHIYAYKTTSDSTATSLNLEGLVKGVDIRA